MSRSRSAASIDGVQRRSSRQFERNSSRSLQKPTASPAAYAAPSAVVWLTTGRITGTPRMSAWNCMSVSLPTMPPSTFSSRMRTPESASAAASTSRVWNAVASRAARAMCALVGEAREAQDRAARVRPPVGGEEPGERRHEDDPAVVVDGLGERLDLGRVPDDAEVVAQPLDERAGDRDRALEGVARGLLAEAVRDGRDEPVAGVHDLLAGVDDEEVAGAVGVLRLAGGERGLPERRGLLIAEDAGDRYAGELARRDDRVPYTSDEERISRQQRRRDAEFGQEGSRPTAGSPDP